MSGFHLFDRFGVELEYMIVQRDSLNVLPVCDEVMRAVSGSYDGDVEMGELNWSNELVLHVIETKTAVPVPRLDGLAAHFQSTVRRINEVLDELGGRLMPTAMHPWMDPASETRLWPHDYNPVYEAFDRIFGCQGHGWANLQSAHMNLPFANDVEFGQLHAAVRVVLPILPALAASSPIVDGAVTGIADTRVEVYRLNSRRIPAVSGRVIPEAAHSEAAYAQGILEPLYRDLAPHDPEGILRYEWVNARGAIARFDRQTIEIRLLDVQECPLADIAILKLVSALLRDLIAQRWCSHEELQAWPLEPLERILLEAMRRGEHAEITDDRYLRSFGMDGGPCTAGQLWRHVFEEVLAQSAAGQPELEALRVILHDGTLSSRILAATGAHPDRSRLVSVYRELCDCLAEGRMFQP